jgi:hypothetical protein
LDPTKDERKSRPSLDPHPSEILPLRPKAMELPGRSL